MKHISEPWMRRSQMVLGSGSRVRRLSIALCIVLFALLPLSLYVNRQSAEAQCGTSASSCKNCHEVQGKDPVSANGEWHSAHAFGDFCEFCHAGSVESKTQDEAHVGMVDPMSDVKASCQSCHPQDYQDQAQIYAAALGIQLTSGGSDGSGGAASGGGAGGGSGAPSGGAAAAAPSDSAGASTADADASSNARAGDMGAAPAGELVDFNVLYAESQATEQTFTTGDIVLMVLIGLLLLALLVAIWKLEHWGDRLLAWWQQNMLPQNTMAFQGATGMVPVPMASLNDMAAAPVKQTVAAALVLGPAVVPAELEELYQRKPELRQVVPYLVAADDKTLEALAVLLPSPGARAAIVRLSKLDLSLVGALQELSPADQALLLALAQKR
jgi:hypothetical protein